MAQVIEGPQLLLRGQVVDPSAGKPFLGGFPEAPCPFPDGWGRILVGLQEGREGKGIGGGGEGGPGDSLPGA